MKQKLVFILVVLFVASLVPLSRENYLQCLRVDPLMCLKSKKFISPSKLYSFRYPADYPLTAMTGSEMREKYLGDFSSEEWVNFSEEWYPNAGGERLGSVRVKKESQFNTVEDLAASESARFEAQDQRYKTNPPKNEYISVAGQNALRVTMGHQPFTFSTPSDDYVIIKDGHRITISFDYDDYYHKLPVEYYNRGKQIILSTFTLY